MQKDIKYTDTSSDKVSFTPATHKDEPGIFARSAFFWGDLAWFHLVARDDDDCVELTIESTSLNATAGMSFTYKDSPPEWSFATPDCSKTSPSVALQFNGNVYRGDDPVSPRGIADALDASLSHDYRQARPFFLLALSLPASQFTQIIVCVDMANYVFWSKSLCEAN